MSARIEELGTDMFRSEHRVIRSELDEIEREFDRVIDREASWRQAVPSFRRLLVLLETDVEHHADEEEHALFAALERLPGGTTPTLAMCYREHQAIRLESEALRHDLACAFSGRPPPDRDLFARSAHLIELLRAHMAREDEVLFAAAEQQLPRGMLIQIGSGMLAEPHGKAA